MTASDASDTVRRTKWTLRVGRHLLPLALVGLAVHLILPQITTLEHSLQVVRKMAWWAFALAVVAQMLSYLGSGYLLRMIVAVVGQRLSIMRGALIFTAASSVGLAGGGPVGNIAATYRWIHGSGVNAIGATLAGWLPTLFNNVMLMLMGIFGLIHLLAVHQLSTLQVVGFGLILLVLVLAIAVLVLGAHQRSRVSTVAMGLARRWAKLRRHGYEPATTEAAVERWFSAWDTLRTGGWRGPALGALLNTGFDMLTLYLLFVAAGHSVSPGILLAGYGLPLLLGKLSFLPGGVGIVEATMTALYDGLGVPDGVTVVVILIYRFLSFWLPLLIGFPVVPYLRHVTRSPGDSSEGV